MSILHGFMVLSLLSARPPHPAHQVRSLRVTVLSTMLADLDGIGEWGFAALIEVDGRRLLFDTGVRPQTVLANARELGIDLSGVTDVVLSHHHWDHTGEPMATPYPPGRHYGTSNQTLTPGAHRHGEGPGPGLQ